MHEPHRVTVRSGLQCAVGKHLDDGYRLHLRQDHFCPSGAEPAGGDLIGPPMVAASRREERACEVDRGVLLPTMVRTRRP